MRITFPKVHSRGAKTPQAEPKGPLVGQQSRDLLDVQAVTACRGPDSALSQNATCAILAQKKPAAPKDSGFYQRGYVRDVSEASHRCC